MDNNKLPYVTSTPNLNVKSKQPLSSSSSYPPPTILATTPDSTSLNNDFIEMPNNPPGNTSHKRARSEILTLPEDINIDVDIDTTNGLSLFDDTVEGVLLSVYLDMYKLNSSSGGHDTVVENFAIDIGNTSSNERLEVGHRHIQSINESTSIIKPDIPVSASRNGSMIDSRKAMSARELVELAKVDPKRLERSQVGWLAMDNNKLPYVTSTPNLNFKSKQPLSSSSSYPPPTILATTLDSTSLNNEINEMSNNPPGNTSHKSARSEIFTLPKDINIEGDIDTMDGLSLFDDTVEEDLTSIYLNMNKLNPSSGAHDNIVENFAIDIGNTTINERLKVGHQHSQPINGSASTIKPDISVSASENGSMISSRKAILSGGKLVECAKVDPKHAKRCQVGWLAMDNNKLPYVTSTLNLNVKSKQPLSSSSSYPPPTVLATTPASTSLNNDISEMPNNPPGNTSQKRARSEILTLPEDINIDSDIDPMDGLSFFDDIVEEDLFSAYVNMDKLNTSSGAHATAVENFAIDIGSTNINERLEVGHQHSQSINGSTSTIKPDISVSASENGSMIASRKVMSAAKLVELAKVDPKRAERIWANRQSAARSKEKKARYIFELENKVQKLETEATSLSTQLTILQRDTQRMDIKNDELRLQLQTKRQQLQLQKALKNSSGEEIRHWSLLIGQAMPNAGPMNSVAFGRGQQYSPNTQDTYALLVAQQLQQPQSNSQMQHHQLQ